MRDKFLDSDSSSFFSNIKIDINLNIFLKKLVLSRKNVVKVKNVKKESFSFDSDSFLDEELNIIGR